MNNDYKEELASEIASKYIQLEEDIMVDIIRRIKGAGEITSTADYQLNRLRILGNSSEDIEKMLMKYLNASYPQIFELYDQVVEHEYTRDAALYEQVNQQFIPFEDNKELQQLVESVTESAIEEFGNITQSLGFYVKENGVLKLTPLAKTYSNILDEALIGITSGAFDYNTAIRKAVTQLTNSGLRSVNYDSGRADRVNVAVRRAVLTGAAKITENITNDNAKKLDADYFEVEAHSGARPSHAVWQGRVYSKNELHSVCGLGNADGLLGVNCYHMYYPFIPGVSVRKYSDEYLDKMYNDDMKPRYWNGKEYTLYECKQKQRQMEVAMRAQREKVKLMQSAGLDKDEIILMQAKYQAQLYEYAKFSNKMGLRQQRERIYYDMQGRVAHSSNSIIKLFHPDMIKNASSDITEYKKLKSIAGGEIGTLAEFGNIKYNDEKQYWLLKGYEKAVNKGDVHALVGFSTYKAVAKKIEDTIIGSTTVDGVNIESYTTHFVDRIIGQVQEDKKGYRRGISVADAKNAVVNPETISDIRVMKDGDKRKQYISNEASVVVSIRDNRIIQANPRRKMR